MRNPLKSSGKAILCALLEAQVKRLRKRHSFTVVAVAGSVGKTSTKLAIAKTLASRQKVVYQDGNYNDRLTVPLVLFGHKEPGIFNIFAWLKILIANERIMRSEYQYETAVLELGTDGPGQMAAFAYLKPELVVITAIAAEHMEYFGNIQNVAAEELAPVGYSGRALLSSDDIAAEFLPSKPYSSYGRSRDATFQLSGAIDQHITGQSLKMNLEGEKIEVKTSLIGPSIAKSLLAAAAVAHILKWEPQDIERGLSSVGPVSGRMQILDGLRGSYLLDDTYNASPIAVRAALEALYSLDAIHRIVILGSMNELGDSSEYEHTQIGKLCDPRKLDAVVTVGTAANEYLARAAERNGCKVVRCGSPYKAGAYVKDKLDKGTIVLAKGSQNGVFTEEALKLLLNRPADSAKLVRQSKHWLHVKRQQFPDAPEQR